MGLSEVKWGGVGRGDYHLEALHGAVVGVHHELGERGELGGAVPAVTTVHQNIALLQLQVARYHYGTLEMTSSLHHQ